MIVRSCVGYLLPQCGNLFVSLCVRYHKEPGHRKWWSSSMPEPSGGVQVLGWGTRMSSKYGCNWRLMLRFFLHLLCFWKLYYLIMWTFGIWQWQYEVFKLFSHMCCCLPVCHSFYVHILCCLIVLWAGSTFMSWILYLYTYIV